MNRVARAASVTLWTAKFLLVLILDLACNFFMGFVFSQYWWWFIGPLTKIPVISPLHALGLILTARFLLWKTVQPHEDKDEKTMLERGLYTTIESAIHSLLFLGIGMAVYTLAVI